MSDFTLIGTTDRDFDGDPAEGTAIARGVDYLCDRASANILPNRSGRRRGLDLSGVRPLYDDGASDAKAATRDYVFELDTPGGARCSPFTAARSPPTAAWPKRRWIDLSPYLPQRQAREGWTAESPLPGGDLDVSASGR